VTGPEDSARSAALVVKQPWTNKVVSGCSLKSAKSAPAGDQGNR
jgi:hypothetical protein